MFGLRASSRVCEVALILCCELIDKDMRERVHECAVERLLSVGMQVDASASRVLLN